MKVQASATKDYQFKERDKMQKQSLHDTKFIFVDLSSINQLNNPEQSL